MKEVLDMGCLVFIISIIGLFPIYGVIGGLIGQYIVSHNHIAGADTNYVFMPIFFYIVPALSFISALVIVVIFTIRRDKKKGLMENN